MRAVSRRSLAEIEALTAIVVQSDAAGARYDPADPATMWDLQTDW